MLYGTAAETRRTIKKNIMSTINKYLRKMEKPILVCPDASFRMDYLEVGNNGPETYNIHGYEGEVVYNVARESIFGYGTLDTLLRMDKASIKFYTNIRAADSYPVAWFFVNELEHINKDLKYKLDMSQLRVQNLVTENLHPIGGDNYLETLDKLASYSGDLRQRLERGSRQRYEYEDVAEFGGEY